MNRGTADLYALLMALQGQGLAEVVQEGDVPDAGVMVRTFEADGLEVAVRHGERLRSDGAAGFVADAVVAASSGDRALQEALALLSAPRRAAVEPAAGSTPFVAGAFVEKDYSEAPYPDRPHRLLALFRLYNAIEYFFPYKDLMDSPWRETLAEFIPRMRDARDATDYALTVLELAARIQDSHVTLASPVLDACFGTHRPAVRVDLVERMTVVTEVAPQLRQAGLRVGDVVLSVDGEDAPARRARLARYLPASTPGRLENKIDSQFLLGPESRPAVIEVRGPDGAVRRVSAPRTLEGLAEHICMLIKSAAAPTFVGSRTSGANGGVTRTILPGGMVVNFTGQSVRHGDGSRLQRVGIVPDIEARPTLEGIRAGRDEVLERAVEFLKGASS